MFAGSSVFPLGTGCWGLLTTQSDQTCIFYLTLIKKNYLIILENQKNSTMKIKFIVHTPFGDFDSDWQNDISVENVSEVREKITENINELTHFAIEKGDGYTIVPQELLRKSTLTIVAR